MDRWIVAVDRSISLSPCLLCQDDEDGGVGGDDDDYDDARSRCKSGSKTKKDLFIKTEKERKESSSRATILLRDQTASVINTRSHCVHAEKSKLLEMGTSGSGFSAD